MDPWNKANCIVLEICKDQQLNHIYINVKKTRFTLSILPPNSHPWFSTDLRKHNTLLLCSTGSNGHRMYRSASLTPVHTYCHCSCRGPSSLGTYQSQSICRQWADIHIFCLVQKFTGPGISYECLSHRNPSSAGSVSAIALSIRWTVIFRYLYYPYCHGALIWNVSFVEPIIHLFITWLLGCCHFPINIRAWSTCAYMWKLVGKRAHEPQMRKYAQERMREHSCISAGMCAHGREHYCTCIDGRTTKAIYNCLYCIGIRK